MVKSEPLRKIALHKTFCADFMNPLGKIEFSTAASVTAMQI